MKPSSLSLEAKRTKEEKGARQKSQKAFKLRRPDHRTVLPSSMAKPCIGTQSCCLARVAMPHVWLARPNSPWVHGHALLLHARALSCLVWICFALLGARGFLEPLFFS